MKSKEKRFKELIGDMFTGDYSIVFPVHRSDADFEIFNSKGEWLIDHKRIFLTTHISQYRIWSVFVNEYKMNDIDIQPFMKDMLFKYFKINKKIIVAHSFFEY